MKATVLGQRIKELTQTTSYDKALTVVEQALQKPIITPLGVTLMIDPECRGQYWPTVIGQNLSLAQLRALQAACRHFADMLETNVQILVEKEIEARVRAEMDKDSDL